MAHTALSQDQLRRQCDPASLNFETTASLEPVDGLVGQDRALDALKFGIGMDAYGYNIYALGTQGSGRHNAVRRFVEAHACDQPSPDDWLYVHNFEEPHRPRVINVRAGQGVAFAAACDALIEQLKTGLRTVFESEDYRLRQQSIERAVTDVQQSIFKEVSAKAETQGLRLVPQQNGMAIVPIKSDGEPMTPQDIQALPEAEREALETASKSILEEFSAATRELPQHDRERRKKLAQLNHDMAALAVDRAFEDQFAEFENAESLADHLAAMRADILANPALFLQEQKGDPAPLDQTFNRFRANAFVRREPECGSPVVFADFPDISHLIGRIEHVPHMGAMLTDFTLIKPGALHQANGGYLLIDAERLLTSPMAWRTLKRRLRSREIVIEPPTASAQTMTAVSLEPAPIPLTMKVILFGSRQVLGLLSANDPDFEELFKVAADFDDAIERNPETEAAYCRLIAGIAAKEIDRPVDASGCAAMIDRASRIAADNERLTLRIRALADIIREANFWAQEDGSPSIGADHVKKALSEQVRRVDLVREKIHEQVTRQTVLIETDGIKVGQINGLAVLAAGGLSFGKPSRITARVRMGTGKVVDIEREVEMGGPLHTKGVLILSSFIASRYALDVPMALRASLVFEQSYGGVDGDSASSTELYAMLSALADVPIKQGIAVTGSVSQNGEVQAIGGVNEKIEGFFDICQERGLTGTQGVLIPQSNVKHLMLREDVVAACDAGQFAVYAVETIDQGIEILTGESAGIREADGRFSVGSINFKVEEKLRSFAEKRRAYARGSEPDTDIENSVIS